MTVGRLDTGIWIPPLGQAFHPPHEPLVPIKLQDVNKCSQLWSHQVLILVKRTTFKIDKRSIFRWIQRYFP